MSIQIVKVTEDALYNDVPCTWCLYIKKSVLVWKQLNASVSELKWKEVHAEF